VVSALRSVLLGNAHSVSSLQCFLTLVVHSVASAISTEQQSCESFRNLFAFVECMDGIITMLDRREKHKKYLMNRGSQYVFIFQTNKNILGAMERILSMTAFTYFSCKSSVQYSGSFIPSISSATSDKAEVL